MPPTQLNQQPQCELCPSTCIGETNYSPSRHPEPACLHKKVAASPVRVPPPVAQLNKTTAPMADAQVQARLFLAPVEIRQAICALLVPGIVHVFRRQGTLCFSRCVTPSPCRDDDGYERRTMRLGHKWEDRTWANRLRSSWGPHWKCEEALSGRDSDAGITPLLLVCRQM